MAEEGGRESRGNPREQANGSPSREAQEVSTQPPSVSQSSILWTIVDVISVLMVLGMLVAVSVQIISRLMEQSLAWTGELTRLLFLWAVFLGMASGFRTGEHARITVVLRLLPQAVRRFAVHLYALLGVLFFGAVAYYGAMLSLSQYGGQVLPALQIGVFFFTASIAVSALLAMVAHIQSVYFDPAVRRRLEGAEEVVE